MRPPDKNAYEKEINRLQGGSDIFSLQAVENTFAPYGRYVFADNTVQSLTAALTALRTTPRCDMPVEAFSRRAISEKIIEL